MNYTELAAKFAKARDPSKGAVIASNTRVVKDGDNFAVKYHDTNVVTVTPDNTIILNSGGWHSNTTKARFNEYADSVAVSQAKGLWTVYTAKGRYPFADGMTITLDGTVTGAGEDPNAVTRARGLI